MIIALEGIDACGKATQTKRLKAVLSHVMEKVEVFDFPHYQTTSGALVGRIIRGETIIHATTGCSWPVSLDVLQKEWSADKAHIIQSMMMVDKLEHQDLVHAYFQEKHKALVLDRYVTSGIVYGQADGLDRDWLVMLNSRLWPADLTVVIDISVEESLRRRPERRDYYEKNTAKLHRVRNLYHEEVVKNYTTHALVDGHLPVEQVTTSIVEEIVARFNFKERFTGLLPES